MINIGICDDDSCVVDEVKNNCELTLESEREKYTIHTFYNGVDVISSDKDMDIIFLDVNMPTLDGFQVARKLREKYADRILIIFLSSHEEVVQKAFEVQAFRYVYKRDDRLGMIQALKDALNVLAKAKKGIWIKIGQEPKFIQYKDIIYIGVKKDLTFIEFANSNGCEIVAKSLKWWQQNLNEDFIRCHRSYIVNCMQIKEFSGKQIKLSNEHKIPVSVRNHTQVKIAYLCSLKKKMYQM